MSQEDKSFFGVRKQEITPKQVEEAADNGMPFINYPHLHRQIALPYFEFVYDEYWDLGHGWSGDL